MSDRRAALEAAIDEHPDLPASYLVLADWLQEHQDPRGELVILSQQDDPESRARCVALQQAIGPAEPDYATVTWFCGFIQRLRTITDEEDADNVRELLAHPSLRHLTVLELEVGTGRWDECTWVTDLIAEQPRVCWRELAINSYQPGGNEPPVGELNLGGLWAVLPRLVALRARAREINPGPLLGSKTLETLVLDGEVSAASLQPLLGLSAPRLRELELADVSARFARDLATSPLASTLEKLKLPYVEPAEQAELRALLPYVTFFPDDGDEDRYEQTGE